MASTKNETSICEINSYPLGHFFTVTFVPDTVCDNSRINSSNGSRSRRRVLPYMDYIGMCGPKGHGFAAVLVINRVSILTDFGH